MKTGYFQLVDSHNVISGVRLFILDYDYTHKLVLKYLTIITKMHFNFIR